MTSTRLPPHPFSTGQPGSTEGERSTTSTGPTEPSQRAVRPEEARLRARGEPTMADVLSAVGTVSTNVFALGKQVATLSEENRLTNAAVHELSSRMTSFDVRLANIEARRHLSTSLPPPGSVQSNPADPGDVLVPMRPRAPSMTDDEPDDDHPTSSGHYGSLAERLAQLEASQRRGGKRNQSSLKVQTAVLGVLTLLITTAGQLVSKYLDDTRASRIEAAANAAADRAERGAEVAAKRGAEEGVARTPPQILPVAVPAPTSSQTAGARRP